MDRRSALIKVFLALFFAPLSSAAIHSLQYFTAVTAGESVTFVLLDGEPLLYYCPSNNRTVMAEWIKKFTPHHPHYWDREIERILGEQMDLHHHFSQVLKVFNHTAGNHTMQWMYGCELHDDGTNRTYNLYSYDGTDLLYLNMTTLNWTAANEKAEIFKNKWDTAGHEAKHMIHYLKNKCIDSLMDYVSLQNTSQRKVPPTASLFQKHSSSPKVVCHATGFFPTALNITWRKDGEEFVRGMDLRETLPNQDGSFQKRSILTVSAEDLQKHTYTCVIQHSSLEKEIVLNVSERQILNPGGRSGGGSDGGSMELTGICWIVVAVFAFALVLSLPALMECLFGVQGYLVRGGEGHL
ncbi:H-2 class I histocompatibility antigen, alpha chain-like isoform X4 [Ictalurus furcatus]|uniref:H-2 class I histocompatibility antigen, alpha chain-like isoform X4 n=1 Tax=Ictalurus furcatus TaxID=66913 RepID=UPI002350C5B3|nr:H-2 class I histocompatibility antigen, alpha chain-like isoform X4 [Ictalurus furcatus]